VRRGTERLSAFVDSIVAHGTRELVSTLGVDVTLAREVMRTIAHRVCEQYQRTWIYVPVDLEYKLSARDRDIWAKYSTDSALCRKFTPGRIAELSVEYQLTTVQLYCIVKLIRERERAAEAAEFARRQGTLPGMEPPPQGGLQQPQLGLQARADDELEEALDELKALDAAGRQEAA
jgi:Mor family transcriptional regulator